VGDIIMKITSFFLIACGFIPSYTSAVTFKCSDTKSKLFSTHTYNEKSNMVFRNTGQGFPAKLTEYSLTWTEVDPSPDGGKFIATMSIDRYSLQLIQSVYLTTRKTGNTRVYQCEIVKNKF
jgi:hypothetical protein